MEYETLVLVPKTTPMQTNAGECASKDGKIDVITEKHPVMMAHL